MTAPHGRYPRVTVESVDRSRYRPGMEPGEWVPLAITGTLGLAGIGATLWGNLANLAAEKRRDAEAAVEREATAKREAEAARLTHLLDERRAAYADLVSVVSECIVHVKRRSAVSDLAVRANTAGESSLEAFELWTTMSRTAAVVRVLAPREVRTQVQGVVRRFSLGGSTLGLGQTQLYVRGGELAETQAALERLINAMHEDLVTVRP